MTIRYYRQYQKAIDVQYFDAKQDKKSFSQSASVFVSSGDRRISQYAFLLRSTLQLRPRQSHIGNGIEAPL